MPNSPPTICHCGGRKVGGKCERCGQKRGKENRGTRTQRGYDNRWLRFSESYLDEHPLCVSCKKRGIVTPATEVHHKIKLVERPDLKYEESNLEATCKPCHSERTAKGQ